jgi:hypothetical protein
MYKVEISQSCLLLDLFVTCSHANATPEDIKTPRAPVPDDTEVFKQLLIQNPSVGNMRHSM